MGRNTGKMSKEVKDKYAFNVNEYTIEKDGEFFAYLDVNDAYRIINELNNLSDENKSLSNNLKDCNKLKTKRLNKIRNHRAVIEDLGGSIRAYKGKLSQCNEKLDKIKTAMDDTGALTRRQLEEILNG